jgi:hypothetical protein
MVLLVDVVVFFSESVKSTNYYNYPHHHVIARYEAIPDYTERTCIPDYPKEIASYLSMTLLRYYLLIPL